MGSKVLTYTHHYTEDYFAELIKEPAGVNLLLDLISIKNFYKNSELTFALEYLGKIQSEKTEAILIYFLNHPSPLVREGAVYGLLDLNSDYGNKALEYRRDIETSEGVKLALTDG